MGATLLVYFINILIFCNGFVLMSSVPNFGDVKLFSEPAIYSLDSTVLLNDIGGLRKDVGYKIKAKVSVQSVWKKDDNEQLLQFELTSMRLHVRSKLKSLEDFTDHKSPLDQMKSKPFFALWKKGRIDKVYIDIDENKDLINFKKGIMSVFQFDVLDGERDEIDVSGRCRAVYKTLSTSLIEKTKTNCTHGYEVLLKTDPMLTPVVEDDRTTIYEFTNDLTAFASITVEESHDFHLPMKEDFGNNVKVIQEFILLEEKVAKVSIGKKSYSDTLQDLEMKHGFVFHADELSVKYKQEKNSANLVKVLKENKKWLKTEHLGTEKSAEAFVRVVTSLRDASPDQIKNALNAVKNNDIMPQLSDALGYVQTLASHMAAKGFLHFDNEYDFDNVERYLWALSIGNRPNMKVILDIVKMSTDAKVIDKLRPTLYLTAASMSRKYALVADPESALKVSMAVKDLLTTGLSKCKDIDCQINLMRALTNYRQPDILPLLIDHIRKSPKQLSVLALVALRNVPKEHWNSDVIKLCKNVFYQLEKRYDSTAKIVALDVLIENRITDGDLKDLLSYLASKDKEFEVKQYVMQRINVLVEKCPKMRNTLKSFLRDNPKINNYHVFSNKGLSTVFERVAGGNSWANISLISQQEIKGGMPKRGTIDIGLVTQNYYYNFFTIGVTAAGLSSLMGSSDSDEMSDESETSSAAIDISLTGVNMGPITLFTGSGELMGHVWSGTASERTPFFQAITMPLEWTMAVPLSSGVKLQVECLGAGSVDLAGQIHISIWHRVAHTLIESNTGLWASCETRIESSIARVSTNTHLSAKAVLDSESDVDFLNNIAVCVRVKQPDTVIKHNTHKTESIVDSKHRIKRTLNQTYLIPGKTYALNRKNNEMCNTLSEKKE